MQHPDRHAFIYQLSSLNREGGKIMDKSKRVINFFCLTMASVALLTFISAKLVGAADPQYKFRISSISSQWHPMGAWVIRMAKDVERLSKGRIKLDTFNSGVLGGEVDTISQLRMGSLDMAVMTTPIMGTVEPTFSVCELPYIFKNDESARKTLDGPTGQKILNMLEIKGIKGIAWGEIGWRGFMTTKKPIEKLEDFKGLKIRVVENPLYILNIKTFGGNPVPMNWLEVYTALDQGTIDGVETNYNGMYDAKFHEVAKCVALTNHIYTGLVLVMNLKTFQNLPKDLQQAIFDAAKESQEYCRQVAVKSNEDAIQAFRDKGLQVTRPARKPFEDLVPKIYKRFSHQIGQDIIDEVIAAQK